MPGLNLQALELSAGSQAPNNSNIIDSWSLAGLETSLCQSHIIFLFLERNKFWIFFFNSQRSEEDERYLLLPVHTFFAPFFVASISLHWFIFLFWPTIISARVWVLGFFSLFNFIHFLRLSPSFPTASFFYSSITPLEWALVRFGMWFSLSWAPISLSFPFSWSLSLV